MRKKLEFLRKDIAIQKGLLWLVVLSIIFPVLLIITLPLLGLWQLFSGVYLANLLKDTNRYVYFLFSLIWILAMVSFCYADINLNVNHFHFWFSLIFIIFPLIMAGGYLKYSMETLSDLEEFAICQF